MKVSKKILALSLAACMTVPFLAGCNSSSSNEGTSEGTDGAGASAASGDFTGTLVIGGIGPVTGGAAVYGNAVKNGIQLAVDEINAAGGVNGIKLELNFQDDEHNEEKAVNAYNTLKDKDMKLLIGTVTSNPCIAVAAETAKDNMFQLTPSGSAVDCVANDNAFRICFNDPNQGIASAQYIAQNGVASKVAVIYDSSDVYSTGIYEKFAAEAANQNLEVVAAEAFTSDSKTDFSVQIQKVQESGAELLFLPIYYQEAALILQQADKAGLSVKYFGCDGLDGLIDQLGEDVGLAEGVMLLTPFAADATDAKTVAFTTAYKAAYNGEVPIQFAADGYDAVYAVKAAMEKAGITDASISASDLCDALKTAMTEITVEGVTGNITWAADGEPTKDPKAMEIVITENADGTKTGTYAAL
ncbi:MAG: ABC transporter substrate-binding protein [Oscillospiraceae bacterium]